MPLLYNNNNQNKVNNSGDSVGDDDENIRCHECMNAITTKLPCDTIAKTNYIIYFIYIYIYIFYNVSQMCLHDTKVKY